MATYKFKEMDASGKIVLGKQTAGTRNDVITAIRSRGSTPITVEEDLKSVGDVEIKIGSGKVKSKDLAVFSKQLYTMLNAGMPLLSCIEALRDQSRTATLKNALTEIYQDLQKGAVFSTSIEKHPNVFPSLYLSMVRSGELSGNLDRVLNNLSIHYQKEAKIQAQIKSAMIYPIILLTASVAVTTLLIVFLIPMFKDMFQGKDLPGITQFMLNLSDFVRTKWYLIIGIILGIVILFRNYSKTTSGRLNIDTIKLKIPIISGFQRTIISSRFASTLAVLISSGIPIIDSIESSAEITNNSLVVENMKGVIDNIKKGSPLSSELKKMEIFPPMMLSMIKIGEDSGSLDTMLTKTSEFYEEELEEAVKRMSSMMEPAMIILLGGVVATVLLSIYLPMFQLSTSGGFQ